MLRNAFADMSTEESTQTMLYLLALIADKLGRLDTADRLTVNVETGSLGTVTTVADISRLNAMGAASRVTDLIPHNMSMMGTAHLYNNIVVS